MKIEAVLKEIEALEEKEHFTSVPQLTGRFLEILVLAKEAQNILELGCSAGYSTLWMAKALKKTKGHITTTEKDERKISFAKKHFKQAEVENITLYEGNLHDLLPTLEENSFDLVFVDAIKEKYLDYFEAVLPLLRKEGIIIFDNCMSHKDMMQDFLEKIKTDTRIQSTLLPFDNGLVLAVKR